jgi:hypothetical protein
VPDSPQQRMCATGFASAFGNRCKQAIPHWQSQWHTLTSSDRHFQRAAKPSYQAATVSDGRCLRERSANSSRVDRRFIGSSQTPPTFPAISSMVIRSERRLRFRSSENSHARTTGDRSILRVHAKLTTDSFLPGLCHLGFRSIENTTRLIPPLNRRTSSPSGSSDCGPPRVGKETRLKEDVLTHSPVHLIC